MLPPVVIHAPTGVVVPDRTTIISYGGYTLSVPPGTVGAPAEATVAPAPTADDEASGPAVDVHIDGEWSDGVKAVELTLPLPPDGGELGSGWEPGVVHDLPSGDRELFLREALDVDASAGTVSVSLTSLSRVHATWFPSPIISAPSVNYHGTIKATEWAIKLFRSFIGQRADQPDCSPAADATRVSTSGNAFDPQAARGGEAPIKHCVQATDGAAEWKLANNTGAVLQYTAADAGHIDAVGVSSDLLTTFAYERHNGTAFPLTEVDIPPGTAATVSVPAGQDGFVSFFATDVDLLVSTFALQQIGSLVPGESEAKKLYNALTDCGWSLGVSLKSFSAQLRCARGTAGIAGTRIAKVIEKPLLLVNALASELDTIFVAIDPLEAHLAYSAETVPPPGGGTSESWTAHAVGTEYVPDPAWLTISCGTPTSCFAAGFLGINGGIWARSTDPTVSGAWTVTLTGGYPYNHFDCRPGARCVGAYYNNGSGFPVAGYTAVDPATGDSEYSYTTTPTLFADIACPGTSTCVGIGGTDLYAGTTGVYVSTAAFPDGGGEASWSPVTTADALIGRIACPTTSLCVGGGVRYPSPGTSQIVFVMGDPAGTSDSWRSVAFPSDDPPGRVSVSCASEHFCAAVAGTHVYTSTDPADPGSWNAVQLQSEVTGNGTLESVSCPSASFCAASDSWGDALTSTAPASGAASWTATHVADAGFPTTISCPSESFCAMTNGMDNTIWTTTDP